MIPALQILSGLPGFRRSGEDRYFCQCPCHPEKTASLRITVKPDRLLLFCFGCHAGAEQILRVLNLPWAALYADSGYRVPKKQRDALAAFREWRERELVKACEMLRLLDGQEQLSLEPVNLDVLRLIWREQSRVLYRFELLRTGSQAECLGLWREDRNGG